MPRYARKRSSSKVYHVMLRGINRMPIFLDNDDRNRFLETISRMKKEREYEIYVYCLMDNHIHLLMKEGEDTIQRSLKRIGVSYAYYFNKKYDRVGHVFQDRFRSETIENDSYLMAAARYIHNNPVMAGTVEKAVDYPWSSYHEYIKFGEASETVNTKTLLGMLSDNETTAIKLFEEYTNQPAKEQFIDIDNKAEKPEKPVTNAACVVEELLKSRGYSLTEIKKIKDRKKRDEVLREIKEKSSMSIRELSRVLGISKDIIFRA
jgi:REP element-mobilizing transposase RayT